ncbi:MAG: tetratricopeptide repeat protein [Nitrospirota bacterium]
MTKVLLVCLAIFLFLANCQKKEEPKVQTPFPAGPVQTQNEIGLLQDAVRKDPKNLSAWINLGNIMMDTSRFDEAIDAYQHALELDPENVDVRVDMGTCYRSIGRPDKAVEEFRKAVKINPRHLYAHRNLGVVLAFDIGDKKSAIKEFEEYLRLSPDTPDTQRIRQEIAKLKASK